MSGEKNSILKVRDKDGKFVDIPAIKGRDAYEYAVDGGFAGTEADFIQVLNENLTDFDGGHISNKNNPHCVTAEQVGALPYYNYYGSTVSADSYAGESCIVKGRFSDIPILVGGVNLGDTQGTLITLHYVNEWTKQYFVSAHKGNPVIKREGDYETGFGEWVVANLSDKGGIVNGNIDVFADKSKFPTISVGENSDNRIRFVYTDTGNLDIQNVRDGEATVLSLSTLKDVPKELLLTLWADQTPYRLFGEHNKPKAIDLMENNRIDAYVADTTVSPQFSIGQNDNNRASLQYSSTKFTSLRNVCGGKVESLALGNLDLTSKTHLLQLWTRDGTGHVIFGQHNKPTGTYGGNGESSKTVTTGGVGNLLLVWSDDIPNNAHLVTPQGAIFFNNSTVNTLLGYNQCSFVDGVLYIKAPSTGLTIAGKTYKYQVL